MRFDLIDNERLIKQASVIAYMDNILSCDGKLYLTNRRIHFESTDDCSFSYSLDAIVSVKFSNILLVFSDGFTIEFRDSRKEHIGSVHDRDDWVAKILETRSTFSVNETTRKIDDDTALVMSRATLRRNIADHFNDNELQNLCFDLSIEYENLAGETREAKARELVIYCERNGQINQLIKLCRDLRPKAKW
jgi:hypothetical protein